jgi:hypothetical protein
VKGAPTRIRTGARSFRATWRTRPVRRQCAPPCGSARRQRRPASLALEHDTAILCAALICRVALDDRTDDADQITSQLSSLFSAANIGLGAQDTDTPGALAQAHDTATLADALVGRLALDGRVDVANKVALLLRSINIGSLGASGGI